MATKNILLESFQNLSNALNRGLSDFKEIESSSDVLLKQWKKDYNAYLRNAKMKRKRKNYMSDTNSLSSVLTENVSVNASIRPTRNARNIAIDNIRKHSVMPLKGKLRRPDSGDEVDCYNIASSKRLKSIAVEKEVVEEAKEIFLKPTKVSRKKYVQKVDIQNPVSDPGTNDIEIVVTTVENTEKKESIGLTVETKMDVEKTVALEKETIKEIEKAKEVIVETEKVRESHKTEVMEVEKEIEKITPQRHTRSNSKLNISSPGLSYVAYSPVEPFAMNGSLVMSNDIGNKTHIVTSIRETLNESSMTDISVKNSISVKSKGDLSIGNESDIFQSTNITCSTKNRKNKNASNTFVDFIPNAESSSLHFELDKTHNITPGNNTFVVNSSANIHAADSESRADIFAHITETVVKGKKPVSNEIKEYNSPEIPEKSFHDNIFQVPFPIPSKRTKVVKASKYYDVDGNLINEVPNNKRTKILTAPTVSGVPDVTEIPAEGRPVRVRTKVRRFGMSEEADPVPTEPPTLQAAKAVSRKSKARRASLKINQNLLTKLQASHKKQNTPLATVTNNLSAKKPMYIYHSATKENPLKLKKKGDHVKVTPKQIDEEIIKSDNLKSKQQKEELAALKKNEEINRKKELLKQKNDEKLERAKKIRQKQEEEKLEQIIQTEKEKELKRKIILQERENKQKEELNKKKLISEQKQANHEERRRLEKEARIGKIKEMELEQQRQLEEKQKRLEYEEKRAKERIEEKKRMLEAERMQKQKMAEAQAQLERKQRKNYQGQYLPRNEDDLGLEDEHSEESGDDEDDSTTPAKHIPAWARDKSENPIAIYITAEQMKLFMPLRSKTPDVHRMFNMSPARKLRRTSSAIWETTILTPS